MVEAGNNIYRLDITFTGHSLSGINPYLIKGEKRNLLIETALNTDLCETQILSQLKQLGVSLEQTDVITTHMHVDHCGLLARLKQSSNQIFAQKDDAVYIENYQRPVSDWGWLLENIEWTGTPVEAAVSVKEHIAVKFLPGAVEELTKLDLGDQLSYGGYQFQVIDLAGHTAAQIGLWDQEQKILFCGDHLLSQYNPNLTTWNLTTDYLEKYRVNLNQVLQLQVKHLYPAHGGEITDVPKRVQQYLDKMADKQDRIERILQASKGALTAYLTAKLMYSEAKFKQLSPVTRWFVCSDVLAYLQHLVFTGRARCELKEGTCYYSSDSTSIRTGLL